MAKNGAKVAKNDTFTYLVLLAVGTTVGITKSNCVSTII